MLSCYATNVVLAKARTMFGRRLTQQNYKEMLSLGSVGEITGYLKSHTFYSDVLAGVSEAEIHRGQLEEKLRQKLLETYASLCRYEITIGEKFAAYFIRRSEIAEILHAILLLNAGKPEEYLLKLPLYFTKHTTIHLTELSKIKSFDDLLAALDHTPYQKILESFRPESKERIDYSSIEDALYADLYNEIFTIIRKYTHGEAQKELLDIFGSFIDLTDYERIVRMKAAGFHDADEIYKHLFLEGSFKKRILDDMLQAANAQDMENVLGSTRVGRRALNVSAGDAGHFARRMNYRICRHYMYLSTHSSVVLISYVFLLEAEVNDIITIVEGIRYKMPPKEIEGLLTVMNFTEGSE